MQNVIFVCNSESAEVFWTFSFAEFLRPPALEKVGAPAARLLSDARWLEGVTTKPRDEGLMELPYPTILVLERMLFTS